MKITFLIGNGFDLNLKLKTQYTDFYEYYSKLDLPKDDMLHRAIKKDHKAWANLEMELAKFASELNSSQVDQFIESKIRLEEELVKYLTEEENRFFIENEIKAAESFKRCVVQFTEELNQKWKQEVENAKSKEQMAIEYQFVDFNYTGTLDKLVRICKNRFKPFSSHMVGNSTYVDSISAPLHIHGTLTEDLILGIDSIEQIANPEIKNEPLLTNYLIKSEMNQALGERKMERFKEMIDGSRYVYLYGLSCGDSDQMWWKYLIQWLQKSPQNRLIICTYKKGYNGALAMRKLKAQNERTDSFLKKSLCDEDKNIYEQLKEKICVIVNSHNFALEGIQIKPKINLAGSGEEKEKTVALV